MLPINDHPLAEPMRAVFNNRLARFGVVGAIGAVVNTCVLYVLMTKCDWTPALAGAVATETAILSNFVLHDRWTFQESAAYGQWVNLSRAVRYNAVAIGGLLVSVGVLTLLVTFAHVHYLIANVAAIGGGSAWNYIGSTRLAWGSSSPGLRGALAEISASGRDRLASLQRLPLASILGALLPLSALGAVALSRPGPWAAGATLAVAFALAARKERSTVRLATCVLAPVVAVCSVDYFAWRLLVTNWSAWWISVPLVAAEAFGALHTLGLQYTVWPRRRAPLALTEDPTRLPIYILVATYNEDARTVLEPTLLGAKRARDRYLVAHPSACVEIVVCNDGLVGGNPHWQTIVALAERLGVRCVTRTRPGGAKAGNIECARREVGATGATLIALLDADQIVEPEFLLQTVPAFGDPGVGWVQTSQYYRNLDNPVARWAQDQQAMFYEVLCAGKDTQNAAFICGTNVLLRAQALDEIGGFPQDSVTEDFSASLMLHPRWRSVFVPGVLARGLGPIDVQSYFSQQGRWATGTLGALRSHWRAILLPGSGGLSLAQRINYALACTHYLCGLRDLIYIVAPLSFLLTGVPAVQGSDLSSFLSHFVPYWLSSQVSFWLLTRGRNGLRGIAIGFASFPVLLGSLAAVVLGRRIGFAVTAKSRASASGYPWNLLLPHALVLLLCLFGLGLAVTVRTGAQATVGALWVVYTSSLLAATLGLGLSDWRAGRDASGHALRSPVPWTSIQVRVRSLRGFAPRGLSLQPSSVMLGGVVALAVASAAVLESPDESARAGAAQTFVPAQEQGSPRFGLSLPYQWLTTRPGELAALGIPTPGLVGRTQEISDDFDERWASQLTRAGSQPWVTLIFGAPSAPSPDASLPAIANGVHDASIHRWAREIREFGGPVYVTVLPHVDRNWSLSSAVANGGIPQDVPRAWLHVQSIFQAEGAHNVAWVWSPAAPGDDAAYAPAQSSIDAVLLTLISYPESVDWADPASAISAVQSQHPDKPILLEVSAEGPPDRKAAWLKAVSTAAASARVHALIYHEGSPSVDATPTDDQSWSLASDPESLTEVRDRWAQPTAREVPSL